MSSTSTQSSNLQLTRCTSFLLPQSPTSPSFIIDTKNRSYRHQYSNMYFTRLAMLKQPVIDRASAKWKGLPGKPVFVRRVLDVVKSQLCWIIGTIYMDMPLKPNVLEDLGRDYSIPPPPPREKFHSDDDAVMLEDESGRVKLVGERLHSTRLVTGVIIAALGMETASGDFEVVDICYPELAPFKEADLSGDDNMDVDDCSSSEDEYLAVVSGLSMGDPSSGEAQVQMLVEYLTGETGGPDDQKLASQVTRLIIAGNSFSRVWTDNTDEGDENRPIQRKFGSAAQARFSTHPNVTLSAHLQDLASALPVHVLPGGDDPAGVILPQQPFPRAMFGKAAELESFRCETNPVWLRIECDSKSNSAASNGARLSTSSGQKLIRSVLVTSGQPVLDMYQYLPSPPSTHLWIACSTLKWRHLAPTAPDTLWCHPFRERDPFVLGETPDLYIVGCMPEFGTQLVGAESMDGKRSRSCRVVLVPNFSETGCLVLVNLRTLAVRCVNFIVAGMVAGGANSMEEQARDMQEG
ncbi:DNA polymerase alpha/epsilon subunit B-domain-containing protein [Pisolithus marmoratus]|nr:DNA polymerase alpha/epsilon subunit B-domain-containing protein [Pisolithus marmoratus]